MQSIAFPSELSGNVAGFVAYVECLRTLANTREGCISSQRMELAKDVNKSPSDETYRGKPTVWEQRRRWLCIIVVAALALLAAERLAVGFHALVAGGDRRAAVDLLSRRTEVQSWFAGEPVYGRIASAIYPPATYAMLWPLLGWTTPTAARFVWTAVMLASLVALIGLLLRAAGASSGCVRMLVMLTVASSQAVSYGIEVGQLSVPTMALALAGVALLVRRPATVWRQASAAALLAASLAKPSLTAPLLLVALLAPAGPAAPLAAMTCYAGVTAWVARFQAIPLADLAHDWLNASRMATKGWGYGNLHRWLADLRMEHWMPAVWLLVLLALGWWVWRQRSHDPWWLLAVSAVIARMWSYHQLYDDILVLVPMAWLLRVTQDDERPRRERIAAGAALLFAWVPFVAPARFLLLPHSTEGTLNAIRTTGWLLMLGALLVVGRPLAGGGAAGE